MTVREAKELCKDHDTDKIVAAFTQLRRRQTTMSLSKLMASCRVSDKLYVELCKRGAQSLVKV